jgi:hypothetical protein
VDKITITIPGAETRSATGITTGYPEVVTARGQLRRVSANGAAQYQRQGYELVEYELVIRDRKKLARDSIPFKSEISIVDARTAETREFEIQAPAVRRGEFIVVGVSEK